MLLSEAVLRQNGYSREKAVAGSADAALAVAALVPMYANYVHPVMCFTEQCEMSGLAREVILCSPISLPGALTAMPRIFGPTHVQYISHALQVTMPMAGAPSRPSRMAAPSNPPAPGGDANRTAAKAAMAAKAAKKVRPGRGRSATLARSCSDLLSLERFSRRRFGIH